MIVKQDGDQKIQLWKQCDPNDKDRDISLKDGEGSKTVGIFLQASINNLLCLNVSTQIFHQGQDATQSQF